MGNEDREKRKKVGERRGESGKANKERRPGAEEKRKRKEQS